MIANQNESKKQQSKQKQVITLSDLLAKTDKNDTPGHFNMAKGGRRRGHRLNWHIECTCLLARALYKSKVSVK